ncbi:hypothetical protein [Vibrio sp. MEBiC08052]|uniref:hypothetical protein n=1 Tax=Vibrio sp. MEBiC08052 TaxID=1761910 RepID=UPI00074123C2|nr:hypothetical protein [Vibrio sp. MEBiC08052]
MSFVFAGISIVALVFIAIWIGPYLFFGIRAGYGSLSHIQFLDSQLAKDKNKSHSIISFMITNRYNWYCLAFPFIRHRATTTSKSFWVVMWLNSLWIYTTFFVFILGMLKRASLLGFMP